MAGAVGDGGRISTAGTESAAAGAPQVTSKCCPLKRTCESRRNIHDPPTIVHQGQELLCQEVDAFEMNIDHCVKVCLGHLFEVDVLRIASVVHKVVKLVTSPTLKRLADIHHEAVECSQIAGIEARYRSPFLPIVSISRMRDSASVWFE